MTNELKPLRTRLDAARKNTKIELRVFEIDYLISFVLSGMMSIEPLRKYHRSGNGLGSAGCRTLGIVLGAG